MAETSTNIRANMAPELQTSGWLNTPHPLTLASLRGKVVEFARFRNRSLEQFFRGYAMGIIGQVPMDFRRNQIDSNEQNGGD